MLTANEVSSLVSEELTRITDAALLARIRELLVVPYPVERDWDYGRVGERFTCWTVLEHPPSNTGIAHCPQGFGPSDTWGLIFLSGEHMGIGMDSAWFSGSPQESDEVGILGGFLESEEFRLGSGQSLCLEQEIVHVTVATTSAKDRLDISVDRFHHAERNLIRTIVQDSVEVLD